MTTFTREDYEMAAKAAGKHANEWVEPSEINEKGGFVQFIGLGRVETWNPPEDDGDALRLAVKLGLNVRVMIPRDHMELGRTEAGGRWALHGDDPCSATRRAIFRAAIAIGRAMP